MDDLSIVSLMPALEPLIEAAVGVVAAIVTAAAVRFFDWAGVEKEARLRESVQSALDAAAAYAKEIMIRRGRDVADIHVRTEMNAIATQYVIEAVPKALKHFQIDERGLRDRVTARIGLIDPPIRLEPIELGETPPRIGAP